MGELPISLRCHCIFGFIVHQQNKFLSLRNDNEGAAYGN